MTGSPPAEFETDAVLVAGLLSDQHPDLAGLPLNRGGVGFDNDIYQLGANLAVRLPRRAIAVELVRHEQMWLPKLAGRLPISVPAPVRLGAPGRGYPWPWSVTPWFEGETANVHPPNVSQADRFADFLLALHQPAPPSAPVNPFRGQPLALMAKDAEARIERLAGYSALVTPAVRAAWRRGLAAPPATQALWLHGDLHARNILVKDGRFVAVLDWGDMTSGDVATDLASVWHLFDAPAVRVGILARYGADAAQIDRARAWAARIGLLLVESGRVDHPAHAAMGEAVLRRLGEDA